MIRRAYELAAALFIASACLVVPPASRGKELDAWAIAGLILLLVALILMMLIERREQATS